MSKKRRRDRTPNLPTGDSPKKERAPRRRRGPWRLVAVALAVAVPVAWWALAGRGPDPSSWDVPDPVDPGMQAPVARALRRAREAVVADPADASTWGLLGATCDAHELWDLAVVAYQRAARLAPDDFRFAYLTAVLQDWRGQPPEVVTEAYQRALDLQPGYPPAWHRYAEALVRFGELERAEEAYESALELDPRFALAQRGLGQVLITLERPEEALEHLQAAAELDPENATIHAALAQAHRLVGDTERARAAGELALTLQGHHAVPDPVRFEVERLAMDSASCQERAEVAMAEGRFEDALADLARVAEVFPEASRPHEQLARCYEALGKNDDAIVHFRRAVELDESVDKGHLRLALLLDRAGRLEEALSHLKAAAEQDPKEIVVQELLGNAYFRLGNAPAAVATFETASHLDDDLSPESILRWGGALAASGDVAAAVERFEQAAAAVPDWAAAHYSLGVAREQVGDDAGALEAYGRAAEIDPQHAAAQRLAQLEARPDN